MGQDVTSYSYADLPEAQRDVAETMGQLMADWSLTGRAAIMAEVAEDVAALVMLAAARQHLKPGQRRPV